MGQPHIEFEIHTYDSDQFTTESLRVVERDVRLPGSPVRWRFQVAQSRAGLAEQIGVLRRTMVRSFGLLGLGLIALAAIQAFYGLWPLRRVRKAIAALRSGQESRTEDRFPQAPEPIPAAPNQLHPHNDVPARDPPPPP